jgi:hypothetical protein
VDIDYNAVDTGGGDPVEELRKRIIAGLPVVGMGGGTGAQTAPQAAPSTPAVSFSQAPQAAAQPTAAASPAAQPGTPPVSFTQRYSDEVQRGQQQVQTAQNAAAAVKPSLLQRFAAAGVGALAGAGARNAEAGGKAGLAWLNRPKEQAQQAVTDAQTQTAANQAAIAKEAGIADTESQTRLRDEQAAREAAAAKTAGEPKPEDVVHAYSEALASGDTAKAAELKPRVQEFLNTTKPPAATKENETDKEVSDYLAARNLQDTPKNRDAARLAIGERKKTNPNAPNSDDPKQIADAIRRGEQPPDMKGLYRNTAAVRAELARNGYDLVKADEDWNATQKYLSTLNGQQQTRLRQAVSFTKDSLDQVQDIYDQWQKIGKTSGWKAFNKGSLETAKQLPGTAGDLAHRLEARVADLTSELGTVYKGGNSSTDESLKLAAKNLSGDWNEKTFKDAISDIRKSIQIRENSMKNTGPAGTSSGNAYTPPGTTGGAKTWNPKTGKYE